DVGGSLGGRDGSGGHVERPRTAAGGRRAVSLPEPCGRNKEVGIFAACGLEAGSNPVSRGREPPLDVHNKGRMPPLAGFERTSQRAIKARRAAQRRAASLLTATVTSRVPRTMSRPLGRNFCSPVRRVLTVTMPSRVPPRWPEPPVM